MDAPRPLGLSGRIAAQFQSAQITPLLALLAVLMGLFAVLVTPREEEPQIKVPMIDVLVSMPGFSAKEVLEIKYDGTDCLILLSNNQIYRQINI